MSSSVNEYIAGGLASCIAEALTLPFDTIKVRLQLVDKKDRLNALSILLSEGRGAMFHGLDAALIRQILYGSLRFGFYPPLKSSIFFYMGDERLAGRLLAGLLAGGISSGLCNPTDLIKIRMQGQGQAKIIKTDDSPKTSIKKASQSLKYRNAYQAFSSILKDEGIKGFYKGVIPTMLRASVLAAAELATYDVLKETISIFLKMDTTSVVVHIITAFISSIISCFVSCPFDMVRSRIMNQPIEDGKGMLYNSTIDCFIKSIRKEGIFVIFSGFWAFFMRLGPNTVLTFMFLEFFRKVL